MMSRIVMQVLFVCTGNIFRSPMAQGFLIALAADRGLETTAMSAGTVPGDRPISPNALKVMGEDAHTMADHRSRSLVAEELRDADVVVGMERVHVREAVVLEPEVWPKAFTLKELVRRGEAVGPRRPDQSVGTWLALVGAGRTRASLMGDSEEDDVADPFSAPLPVLRATAKEIRDLVGRLLDLLEP
jgi:protein-tyrosine phosphatase